MLSNITDKQHTRFFSGLQVTLKKFEEIKEPVEPLATERYSELLANSQSLEETYKTYLIKLNELRATLVEYERKRKESRILLRKLQLWFKFVFDRKVKDTRA
jgi:hypothetical protein